MANGALFSTPSNAASPVKPVSLAGFQPTSCPAPVKEGGSFACNGLGVLGSGFSGTKQTEAQHVRLGLTTCSGPIASEGNEAT